MKPIRIPLHASQNMSDRGVSPDEVRQAIEHPDQVAAGYDNRDVYMRRFHDTALNQEMLLRVVIEENESERIVITVYKTSQIQRYLKGLQG